MPIECLFDVNEISKSSFHKIDYQVMRHVFDVQNELGRLYHESIYQAEVAHRCSLDGMAIITEGEIRVSLHQFQKSYFVDALVNHGALYELKAVEDLSPCHESQLLNYMFLCGLKEGKLVNFASPSVQHRFVSTSIGREARNTFSIDESKWDRKLDCCMKLADVVRMLLAEWGAFLDVNLYREAVLHFMGGEEKMNSAVNAVVEDRCVGQQIIPLLEESVCLHVSSVIHNVKQYQNSLERFLEHTNLMQIQWINFSRNHIHLVTLKK